MYCRAIILAPVLVLAALPVDAQSRTPAIDDLVGLRRVGSPAISPEGTLVAYTVRETNWEADGYETEIWVGDPAAGTRRQLTRGEKSSAQPAWSPDGTFLAFVSDRTDKRQIYRIHAQGGEAEILTDAPEGVNGFMWSPNGRFIAYTATDPKSDAVKDRDKQYGEFTVVDSDQRMAHLHVLDLDTRKSRQITSGAFVVGDFNWSPDGTRIAFDHRINSDPANLGTANISIVDVADGRVRPLVTLEGPDASPVWSPDGSRIAFETTMASPWFF